MSHYDKNLEKNKANYVPLTPISFLERTKDIYPNYQAVFYKKRTYTWKQVYETSTKFARALEKHGFKKALIPLANAPKQDQGGKQIFAAKNLSEAIKSLGFG